MGGKTYLGEFEHMVLAAILRLGEGAYGTAIIKEIERETGRLVPSGSLSVTLDRLEKKGHLRSTMGQADPTRGGRPKRFVSVTDVGFSAVRESRSAMLNLWSGLEPSFEDQ
jgi:DNA-binding PadR family transcriptional regulator